MPGTYLLLESLSEGQMQQFSQNVSRGLSPPPPGAPTKDPTGSFAPRPLTAPLAGQASPQLQGLTMATSGKVGDVRRSSECEWISAQSLGSRRAGAKDWSGCPELRLVMLVWKQ